ncbi:MAG: four-carbon acid sugar kinase family protein [Deltaproteobacteria bacterium]|jgi:uncharacterized protein YgbK (DUF1537 family)|nr:four-carbon acid sugar kinase family protein [Deltaproteobacteria bacterium]
MYLGVIADDFTGGTDIAGFLAQNGLSVTQFIGVPEDAPRPLPDAAVISLKSRSCPKEEAARDSLSALDWLRRQGCGQIFFKYCSTFDSTAEGNIGPVTDALLDALGAAVTVMAPALPVNGRSVYCGYLFVNGVPLHESGMRHHPVTPMLDANLMRLTERQAKGKAANIPASVVDAGVGAVRDALDALQRQGVRYAVPDALNDAHLTILGEALSHLPLVTGGSGLGAGLARHYARKHGLDGTRSVGAGMPPGGRGVVFSGSASVMTNAQVARYKAGAEAFRLDARRCVTEAEAYAAEIAAWALSRPGQGGAPLIYATTGPEELAAIQKTFGAEVSGRAVETLFAALAARLKAGGFNHFIVAGGETSGAVVKALGVRAFHIGPEIAPGVPWVRAVDQPLSLALKSGNFGDEDFFAAAQRFY